MPDFAITSEQLLPLLGTPDAPRIFDVRRRVEFDGAERVLPGARWRDPTVPAEWVGRLPPGIEAVVYCSHGNRCSQAAAAILRERGVVARYLSGGIAASVASALPTILKAALPGWDECAPSLWVTRVQPKIDRIACPWLVRRFIDPEARFLFVSPAQVAAVAADVVGIAYDIEGVDFGHEGERCTFDTLIDRFGIVDPALDALATIVRGADTARLDLAPEAAGLLAISLGNSARAGGDDHRALEFGFPVYDAMFAWRRQAVGEQHNWPARSSAVNGTN